MRLNSGNAIRLAKHLSYARRVQQATALLSKKSIQWIDPSKRDAQICIHKNETAPLIKGAARMPRLTSATTRGSRLKNRSYGQSNFFIFVPISAGERTTVMLAARSA
jgi:hypothetical protein